MYTLARAVVVLSICVNLCGCGCSRSLNISMFDPDIVGPDFDAQLTVFEKRVIMGPEWYTYYTLGLIRAVSSIYQQRDVHVSTHAPGYETRHPIRLQPNRDGLVTIPDVRTGDYIVLELAGFAPSSVWVRDACSRMYVVMPEIDRVAEKHLPTSVDYPRYTNGIAIC